MKQSHEKQSHDKLQVKRLIWAYFFLLIFEGALRKWVIPSASNALLIVRDPIVLAAYFFAWRAGLFPRNVFISVAAAIGLLSLGAALITLIDAPAIALYGFRTNFLQLPFIFLIAKVFDARDVEKLGYWTLVLAIPMAALMALQFLAPPQSIINTGSDDNFGNIASSMGRIRPPGTFSFIAGPNYFYAVVAAFLLNNQFSKKYPLWLMVGATLATLCAAAVSGSRSLVGFIAIVFLVGLLCSALLRPAMAFRWSASLLVIAVAGFFLSNLSFFKTGLLVFTTRVSQASSVEGGGAGFLERAFSSFTQFYPKLFEAPLFGQGLGMGTNVGLALMVDKSKFIWFEDEWGRHIMESGPILGAAFILYRIALTAWIGGVAVRHMARRDPLPVLLFGAGFIILLNGLISQSTILGFAIAISGLCLAATRTPARAKVVSQENVAVNEEFAPSTLSRI